MRGFHLHLVVLGAVLTLTSAILQGRPVVSTHGRVVPTARPKASPHPIHVKIDSRWYDVASWADSHPGGRYVLEWADGYDISGAFHTIHLFGSSKAAAALKRLPEADMSIRERAPAVLPLVDRVPMSAQTATTMDAFMNAGERVIELVSPPAYAEGDARAAPRPVVSATGLAWQQESLGVGDADLAAVGRVGDSALKRDLEAMLRRRFSSPAEYKATPEHWARVVGALALFLVCFSGWTQANIPATLVLPFAQWLLFSPTVHEASHSTLSTRPEVNKAAALCGLPFIYNPYIWWPQHILSHHQYTNDDALDVDLHHLRPARLHPGCEADVSASGFNFIFKGYFSTMGMSALWPIRNLQGKSTGRWYENLITPTPELLEQKEFLLSLVPVGFALVWPWLLVLSGQVNALEGFLLWFYPWAVCGAIWTVMTQVSHVQEDCQRPPTGEADDYFRWQIESAVDYSVGSELVPKLTATLNLQSMHHVMPSVCGCHFASLYDEYAEVCAKHNVRLNVRKDVSDAWRTAIARVFALSSPAITPKWAAHPPEPGESPLVEHLPLLAYIGTPVVTFLLASPFF